MEIVITAELLVKPNPGLNPPHWARKEIRLAFKRRSILHRLSFGCHRGHGIAPEDHYIRIQRGHTGATNILSAREKIGFEFVIQHLGKSDRCLIMGCGGGAEAEFLVHRGFNNVTGLDVDPECLRLCAENLNIDTICGDMRATNLPDDSFDVVLCHRSLHHMFNPFPVLEEFARIASRKVAIINEPVKSFAKKAIAKCTNRRLISGANIYEYQFDIDDVHRYNYFFGLHLVECKRYWESACGLAVCKLLNGVGLSWAGNRFALSTVSKYRAEHLAVG